MTQPIWEKVDRGRYAAELHGHTLQAIRKDPPFDPGDRPYIAIVDRVPVGDAWNLNVAKTKAIQHVQRQAGKSKAERLFSNGTAPKWKPSDVPAEQEQISDPVDTMLVGPEADYPSPPAAELGQPDPFESLDPEPVTDYQADPLADPALSELNALVRPELSLPVDEPPQAETALDTAMQHLAVPGQLVISGKLGSGDLLDTLNAMRSALELLREHADVECTINMPPVMKL